MNKTIKKIYFFLFCKPRFINKVAKLGKGSFIREHRIIRGGKYIYIGNNTLLGSYSRMVCIDKMGGQAYKPFLKIGSNDNIGINFTATCSGSITIEDNVLIAPNVFITDLNHGIDPECNVGYECQPYSIKNVRIEEGTWIGQNTTILPGVTIGKKCVIGANSVVTKSIPDFCMAVGNPAKVIKKYDFDAKKWVKIN